MLTEGPFAAAPLPHSVLLLLPLPMLLLLLPPPPPPPLLLLPARGCPATAF
jgi:hypothetical protein